MCILFLGTFQVLEKQDSRGQTKAAITSTSHSHAPTAMSVGPVSISVPSIRHDQALHFTPPVLLGSWLDHCYVTALSISVLRPGASTFIGSLPTSPLR